MKKLLRYADCFVLLAAIIGCLLRLWLQNAGVDSKGLYQTTHPSWLLLCALSVGMVAFLWFLTRSAGDNQRYEDNFRPSLVGSGTYLLLAVVLGYVGINDLLDTTEFLDKLAAIGCMLSAVMLTVTGIERYQGHRPAVFLHLIPCIFFALRMFNLGRDLGTEPEICTFLFGFLASVGLMLAFYYLWAFDMNMANRQRSLFWSLTAAYFCLVTTFESTQNWALYMVFAAFLLSNLCQLKYLAAPAAAEEAPAGAEVPAEEVTPAAKEAPAAATETLENAPVRESSVQASSGAMPPLFPEKSRAVLHADIDPEADMDAFLADIKLFLENEDY